MKKFKDLEFDLHPSGVGGQAKMFFPNGYGISVIQFLYSYTDGPNEWECAVLKGNQSAWDLCYNTPITNDVIGHCSSEAVTKIMAKIQGLKKPKEKGSKDVEVRK